MMLTHKQKGPGILRRLKLLAIRLYRLNDSPQKIALGFGLGVFLGILPGLGVIASVLVAAFLRINRVSALAGSLATNGWTTLVAFILAVKTGAMLSGMQWKALYKECMALIKAFHFKDLLNVSFLNVFLPVFLGYLLISLAAGVVAYLLALYSITRFRRYREQKKARKST